VSTDPSILTIQKSRHSIRISQVVETGFFSHQDFEYLLRSIRYAHDPVRPPVERYTAFFSVSAYDGVFTSVPAVTIVDVLVVNTPPAVLINGASNASAVMADGEATIKLLDSGTIVTLFEDSTVIREVSITLTNPSHSEELIQLSPINVPSSISVLNNGSEVVLIGPATPVEFSQALTDSTLFYQYPPMESILQGNRPHFTPR
jgi:hypothetical protein